MNVVRKKCEWCPGATYHTEIIKDDSQMLTTTRYIHLNPVRAKMVKNPEEYEHSSYSMYIGNRKEKLISSERVLSYFKEDFKRELYRGFVEKSIKLKDGETVI